MDFFSFDVAPTNVGGKMNGSAGDSSFEAEGYGVSNDRLPVGAIPLFATSSPDYEANVNKLIASTNQVYSEFINSDDGFGFCGQICLVGDSVGSILAYDAICRQNSMKRSCSDTSVTGSGGECNPASAGACA